MRRLVHALTALALTLTTLPGCVMQAEEADTAPTPEEIGTTEQATNSSGLTVIQVNSPSYPDTIKLGQKFEALSFKFVCVTPGCSPGPIAVRQPRILVVPSAGMNIGEYAMYVNGQGVANASWSNLSDQVNVFNVGNNVYAYLNPYQGNILYWSSKYAWLGLNDVMVNVGDVISLTAISDNAPVGSSLTFSVQSSWKGDPAGGSPSYKLPDYGPSYNNLLPNQIWFWKSAGQDDTSIADLMFKVGGIWYSNPAPFNLSNTVTRP